MFFINYETVIDPILKDLRELVPETVGMKAGDSVLDVCCGTGAQVLEYARHGINSQGLDNSLDMIKTANRNRVKHQLFNSSFKLGDARELPYDDNHFDYVSVSFAIHDKEGRLKDEIVSEMKRVAKENGTLIFIDFNTPLPKNIYGLMVRFIEFAAGGSHYRGFKEYSSNGGLDTLVKKHNLHIKSRNYFKQGIALLVTAGKS